MPPSDIDLTKGDTGSATDSRPATANVLGAQAWQDMPQTLGLSDQRNQNSADSHIRQMLDGFSLVQNSNENNKQAASDLRADAAGDRPSSSSGVVDKLPPGAREGLIRTDWRGNETIRYYTGRLDQMTEEHETDLGYRRLFVNSDKLTEYEYKGPNGNGDPMDGPGLRTVQKFRNGTRRYIYTDGSVEDSK